MRRNRLYGCTVIWPTKFRDEPKECFRVSFRVSVRANQNRMRGWNELLNYRGITLRLAVNEQSNLSLSKNTGQVEATVDNGRLVGNDLTVAISISHNKGPMLVSRQRQSHAR